MVINLPKIKLMQGDCFERMKEIERGSVDMILTDPPYELSKSKGAGMLNDPTRKFASELRDAKIIDGIDTSKFLDSCVKLFEHTQLFNGVFFCSNKQIIEYLTWAEINKFQYGVGVWHKTNPVPLCNNKYLNDLEYWIYIKGNKSKIRGEYSNKSMMYSSQVNKSDKKKYNHPTIKPLMLLEKLLKTHSQDGETILDPFMGSGSTGVAAKNLNRKFIGVELEKNYFYTSASRIQHGA